MVEDSVVTCLILSGTLPETTSDIHKAKTCHRRKSSETQSSESFRKRFLHACEGLLSPWLVADILCCTRQALLSVFACVRLFQPYEGNATTLPTKMRKKLRHKEVK